MSLVTFYIISLWPVTVGPEKVRMNGSCPRFRRVLIVRLKIHRSYTQTFIRVVSKHWNSFNNYDVRKRNSLFRMNSFHLKEESDTFGEFIFSLQSGLFET